MKRTILPVVVAWCLVLSSVAAAQDAELDGARKKFEGAYVNTRSLSKERDIIDRSIETLVDEMTFYKRPFARSALKDSTEPCPRLDVVFSGQTMAINCQGRRSAKSPQQGQTVRWVDGEGEEFELSQTLEKSRMVQVFQGEDGTRKNVYTLEDDGTKLRIAVTITSDDLPRPLKYTRVLQSK